MNLELITSPDAPAGFPYLEHHVRERLGIPLDEIRELRKKLAPQRDWTLRHKRVWISLAGVTALLALVGLEKPAPTLPAGNAETGAAVKTQSPNKSAPKKQTLLAVRATKNPRILLACAEDDNPAMPKKPLRLRVKTTKNFRRGMKVEAQLVAGYTDLFDLVGRMPRKATFLPTPQI